MSTIEEDRTVVLKLMTTLVEAATEAIAAGISVESVSLCLGMQGAMYWAHVQPIPDYWSALETDWARVKVCGDATWH